MTFAATILTLYPEMFPGPLGTSLAGRALGSAWTLETRNIRDFATDKHRSVDDTPAGGGPGGSGQGSTGQAGGARAGRPGGGAGGGIAGLLGGGVASAQVSALLKMNALSYTWVAASVGSNNSAGYQLVTGFPVMAIGGFNGSDPSPTLAQFKSHVAAHKIHYFIGSRSVERSHNGSASSAAISAWVAANFTAITVDDVTISQSKPAAR